MGDFRPLFQRTSHGRALDFICRAPETTHGHHQPKSPQSSQSPVASTTTRFTSSSPPKYMPKMRSDSRDTSTPLRTRHKHKDARMRRIEPEVDELWAQRLPARWLQTQSSPRSLPLTHERCDTAPSALHPLFTESAVWQEGANWNQRVWAPTSTETNYMGGPWTPPAMSLGPRLLTPCTSSPRRRNAALMHASIHRR